MRLHHLNCASMCPLGGKDCFVCHCWLIETNDGLILVDTGLGHGDLNNPRRLPLAFRKLFRPAMDPKETALSQVRALGFQPQDVRHIVLTHLDPDHAGGLGDFPWAQVHVSQLEHEHAMARREFREKARYLPVQWRHHPKWQAHSIEGERWFGFDAVKPLLDCLPELLLIPLYGHTYGHCGIAVDTPEGWLLHCGDAYFHHGETHPSAPHCPTPLRLMQPLLALDNRQRLANQQRLRQLRGAHPEIRLTCAHDLQEYATLRAAQG